MNTTNLISTPNINGNVGSCSTEMVTAKGTRTVFVQEIIQVLTNSCNGEVQRINTWELTGFSLLVSLMVAGTIALLLGMVFAPSPNY